MKKSKGGGGSSSRVGGAGSRDRKTKRRRVTADPEALAPKSSTNDERKDKTIVRASASEVDQVLPSVTRDGFEQLVRRQLVEGIPITLADLTEAARSASKRKGMSFSPSSSDTGRKLRKPLSSPYSTSKKTKVINTERKLRKRVFSLDSDTEETRAINTDGWAGIPSDVMKDVLGRLNLRDKVVCVSKVCRAWNAFKTIPGLFVDLSDESGPPTAKDLGRFLKWVPDVKSVTGVRVATTEDCGYMSGCTALSKIVQAHTPPDDSSLGEIATQISKAFSNIEQLALFGPAINTMLLATARSYGIGPALKTLRIESVSKKELSSLAADDVGLILSRSETLSVLEMPAFLLPKNDGCNLAQTISYMVPQGSTGAPLRILDLTKTSSDSSLRKWSINRQSVTWSDVSSIGRYCPHLEVLKLPLAVEENHYSMRALPEVVQGDEMTCLSKLRVFALGRIIPYVVVETIVPRYRRSNETSAIVSWLLRGMPVLEELSLSHGEHSNVHHDFVLPDIGQGLSECPPTLRKLHLRDFNLETTSLLSSGIDSDSIESITLENCGDSQTGVLRSFCLRYQGDVAAQKDISIGVGEDETSYFVRGAGEVTLPDDVNKIELI